MAAQAGGARASGLTKGAFGALAVFLLAGLAALEPQGLAWAYLAAVAAFEGWLARRIASLGRAPVAPGEAPYGFSAEEGELVGRYRFYFIDPKAARDSASVLAAIGLCSLLLCPWLTFQKQLIAAVLVGANVFAVARLTREVALQMTPRQRELHDDAWRKIRAANSSG